MAAGSLMLGIVLAVLMILYQRGAFLPSWVEWDRQSADTLPEELAGRLDPSWLLQQAVSFDIDGNGEEEQILLLWKKGSYGGKMPTWVRHNDRGFSQHIFIYTPEEGEWKPIWMSSALSMQAVSLSEGDIIPGTGRKSLEILQADGRVSRWGWLAWGLMEAGTDRKDGAAGP